MTRGFIDEVLTCSLVFRQLQESRRQMVQKYLLCPQKSSHLEENGFQDGGCRMAWCGPVAVAGNAKDSEEGKRISKIKSWEKARVSCGCSMSYGAHYLQ